MKLNNPEACTFHTNVAPRRGAWIETNAGSCDCAANTSHPAGVRGLKLEKVAQLENPAESHPAGVRGLKRGLANRLLWLLRRRTPQGCVD